MRNLNLSDVKPSMDTAYVVHKSRTRSKPSWSGLALGAMGNDELRVSLLCVFISVSSPKEIKKPNKRGIEFEGRIQPHCKQTSRDGPSPAFVRSRELRGLCG